MAGFGLLTGFTVSPWDCGGVESIRLNTSSNPSAFGVSLVFFMA